MSKFTIREATRVGVRPLIVLYSESGCGKTFSALLMARGIAGPDGKIVMADSESGRGSLYADIPELRGYKVLEFSSFSPADYIEAIDEVEASGAAVGIMDSGSHEWEGIGGVLDMAAENETRSQAKGLHNWRIPKLEHQKFVQRLLRAKIPWIVCLRAKYKTRQGKDDKGKTVIVKDDVTSPIQAEDFIFEATCHAEILPNHSIILTKHSHPQLKTCFPEDKTTPITIAHGAKIAQWCNAAGGSTPAPVTTAEPATLKKLKKELWDLTQSKHGGEARALEQFLIDECLLDPQMTISELTEAQLITIIKKTKTKLNP
jgi:hypothetical protein